MNERIRKSLLRIAQVKTKNYFEKFAQSYRIVFTFYMIFFYDACRGVRALKNETVSSENMEVLLSLCKKTKE